MYQLTIEKTFRVALQHHQAGQLSQAEKLYRQILAQQPKHADALHYLGVIAGQMGRNDISVDLIRQALALQPNNAEAYNNLGNVLRNTRQIDESIAACHHAIALNPNFSEAYNNLGNALKDSGQPDQAIAAFRQAIALNPSYPEAFNNLGTVLGDRGQSEEAIAAYRQAIALYPNYPQAHCNLGTVLKGQRRLEEAIAAYRQAITLKANYAEAHYNLGIALWDDYQLNEAITAYRQAIALRPDYSKAHSNLLLSLHYLPNYDAQTIAEEHRCWDRQHAEPLRQFVKPHLNGRDPDRRIRIGYVSPDFKRHAVAPCVLPLLECHDHEKFEVFCYAEVLRPDEMTERFRINADQWRNTSGLSDEQVAALIRRDQIDLLVDLAGHTAGNRLLVFARKPAPVQVTRQGYPNTTGLTTIDYRLTDALADPPGLSDTIHSERVIRLPQTNWIYQPPEDSPEPTQLHLVGPVQFGCFNYFPKVTEPMLALWAKILASVPNSTLLLKAKCLDSPKIQQLVQQIFARHGISPQRVRLLGWTGSATDHLALYNEIAISLDPFPYHGTTTTCEALWMGVPVITLAGQTHVSRVGVSLLTNMGLEELIAENPEDYLRIAVELSNDHLRLRRLHETLRPRMQQSSLMNAPRFTRNIEVAYRQMWRTWCTTSDSHS